MAEIFKAIAEGVVALVSLALGLVGAEWSAEREEEANARPFVRVAHVDARATKSVLVASSDCTVIHSADLVLLES